LVIEVELMVEKMMERDYFLDAEQALEMGLVDKVLTSRDEQDKALKPLTGLNEGGDKEGNSGGNAKGDDGEGGGPPPSPATNPSPS
jgi:enoyl-CoA hydratase/carnithine racemase